MDTKRENILIEGGLRSACHKAGKIFIQGEFITCEKFRELFISSVKLPDIDLIIPEKVLILKREPNNQFDEFAIAIYCENIRIGFVPAELNLVCSRLMDAGKLFFCRVVSSNRKNKWLKIHANIYMVE